MDPEDLAPDPLVQLALWLAEARAACPLAEAAALATATPDGRPSARMVLARPDGRGVVFFTNHESRKGEELAANPRAALVFHWWELGRQVRVEGAVEQVEERESYAYWRARPEASRISAWASPQSRPLPDRGALDELVAKAAASLADGEIPLPPFWGGYRVLPDAAELWLHRDDRLHDRVRYTRAGGEWRRERLAP